MTVGSLPRRSLAKTIISHYSYYSRISKRFFSSALEWGRHNPQIAQACLAIPPLPTRNPPPLTSLEAYWKWRQWKFPVLDETDLSHGQALVSHVLSAPLTLATFVNKILEQQETLRLCCVGARSEATLPLGFWNEFLVAMKRPSSMSATMDFMGPEILPAGVTTMPPPQVLTYDNTSLQLQWLYQGYLHEYIAANPTNHWDAFVLFNPGLGHAHLKEGWKPTLDYLWQQYTLLKTPILMTAHSELDARRDWQLLRQEYDSFLKEPQKNPFASHICYPDPLDANHRVQPSHSLLMLL
jgi:hypothetical protein